MLVATPCFQSVVSACRDLWLNVSLRDVDLERRERLWPSCVYILFCVFVQILNNVDLFHCLLCTVFLPRVVAENFFIRELGGRTYHIGMYVRSSKNILLVFVDAIEMVGKKQERG